MSKVAYNIRFAGQVFDGQAGLHQNGRRDFDPAIGRYVEVDPIGLFGGSISPYVYAADDSLIYIDPLGLCWVYSQSTGRLSRVAADGTVTVVATGYSGNGNGLNNPAMQDTPNVGPIPQGGYTIQHQQDNTTAHGVLPGSMRLTPNHDNPTTRAGFLIHGPHANDRQDSSNGCPIFSRAVRDQIANSGDTCFQVTQ